MVPSALFLAIQTFSGQAKRKIAVRVGQSIVDFEAYDQHGQRFPSNSLRGKRYLLKCYRGHWCPYCRRELSAWNDMDNELAKRGIGFVAISPDTPGEVAVFTARNPHLRSPKGAVSPVRWPFPRPSSLTSMASCAGSTKATITRCAVTRVACYPRSTKRSVSIQLPLPHQPKQTRSHSLSLLKPRARVVLDGRRE